MQVATPLYPPLSGGRRVRRKTEPTQPGTETVIFLKINTYGAVGKPHLPGAKVSIYF